MPKITSDVTSRRQAGASRRRPAALASEIRRAYMSSIAAP
jgi:hypothetical protein